MLQRREEGERRLGALVPIAPSLSKPSRPPRCRGPTTPMSLSPAEPGGCRAMPSSHRGRRRRIGAGAGVGQGGHLNGLLVEPWAFVVGTIARRRE